ncbi:hypothetical protein P9G84_22500 [Brevibacillus centrosporus]|uniref:hypothetical protein n=1 Tax=Brevibacillus centrosporus TaxID=54910 RepID=UPI00114314CF|nr:hypothetical protein [Brevibacillus centrosporus]MEC2131700.1 hypothetical protein [Brevibacillus centrosporus]
MPDIKDLQGKYVQGLLDYDEMKLYLGYLENNPCADFREDRISKLRRLIDDHERKLLANKSEEAKHNEAALEYRKLTIKWENAGAYWKPIGSVITKWYYKGECFFTWFSGVDAIEHLKSAKQADAAFEQLRNFVKPDLDLANVMPGKVVECSDQNKSEVY